MVNILSAPCVPVQKVLMGALGDRVLSRALLMIPNGPSFCTPASRPPSDPAKERGACLPSPVAPVVDGKRFLDEFARLRPVAAAFWEWDGGAAEWCLWVVTPDHFDPVADHDVGRAAAGVSLLNFHVKLIG